MSATDLDGGKIQWVRTEHSLPSADVRVFVAYLPWVRDDRRIADVRVFPTPPPEMPVEAYIVERLKEVFPQAQGQPKSDNPF